MADDVWAPLEDALDQVAAAGRVIDVWLRDDDAVAWTPALDRLASLARRVSLPVLLAVIPEPAEQSLAAFVAVEPLFTPTQHGFAHVNHAGPGERACELGGARTLDSIADDLLQGRARMMALFGARQAHVLVPPWNRIAPAMVGRLPALGFTALSTFADAHADSGAVTVRNCDLDIIDWRGGRRCHPTPKLVARLVALCTRQSPIGVLTHHLAHDEAAWAFLDSAFDLLGRHPAVRFAPIAAILDGMAHAGSD